MAMLTAAPSMPLLQPRQLAAPPTTSCASSAAAVPSRCSRGRRALQPRRQPLLAQPPCVCHCSSAGSAQGGTHTPTEAAAQGEEGAAPAVVPATEADFPSIARLRANAYYEEDRSRFVESFKKKFVSQEMESLKERTVPGSSGQQCECLVVRGGGGLVVGCIDIRLPKAATGKHPGGVPEEDSQGAYILNVVVDEDYRGQGLGTLLMREAMHRAVHAWRAAVLYTQVEAANEVALHLYSSCGFREHSTRSQYSPSVSIGKLLLLSYKGD